jgi:hypothetical protein
MAFDLRAMGIPLKEMPKAGRIKPHIDYAALEKLALSLLPQGAQVTRATRARRRELGLPEIDPSTAKPSEPAPELPETSSNDSPPTGEALTLVVSKNVSADKSVVHNAPDAKRKSAQKR